MVYWLPILAFLCSSELAWSKGQLHWLPVQQRVLFKIVVLVYQSLNGQAPSYLVDDCQLVSDFYSALIYIIFIGYYKLILFVFIQASVVETLTVSSTRVHRQKRTYALTGKMDGNKRGCSKHSEKFSSELVWIKSIACLIFLSRWKWTMSSAQQRFMNWRQQKNML